MVMTISVESFGETQVSRQLLGMKDRATDARPAFHKIRESFIGAEKYQFSTEGGSSGGWKPLAASTVEAKARAGLDPRILHATHRLRDSLTTLQGEGHIYRALPDEVVMGSEVPYGVFHQSTAPRSRLPRRPPVDLSEAIKRRWVKYLQDYIVHGHVR